MDEPTHESLELQRALGRLEGKMDAANEKIDRLLLSHAVSDDRLGSLERWKAYTVGISATVGTMMGIISSILYSMGG